MAWTTGRTWAVNETLTAAKMNEISASLNALGGAWASYTPSWFASGTAPAIGNGTITGSYRAVGKTVDFRIRIIMGSTTTYGTGVYNFTLPSTPSLSTWDAIAGNCTFTDTSLSEHYTYGPVYSGGSNVSAFATGGTRISNTTPLTFANTDIISITGRYEVT